MRLYGLDAEDAERIIETPDREARDESGNVVYVASFAGRSMSVVVAGDDPDLVITLWEG